MAGNGIALSYDCAGRWRYNRVAGNGIALSYDQRATEPAVPERREPVPPTPTDAPGGRVLCSCGELFTFDGDRGICPSCGRPAEWPTMGQVEREMRSDLDDLLRAHEPGAETE